MADRILIKENQRTLILCLIWLATLGLAIGRIKELEAREPIIIYQVDNAGGLMIGQITDKEIIEGRYTVTAGAYGQYEAIEVGDPIPEYLKGRGN